MLVCLILPIIESKWCLFSKIFIFYLIVIIFQYLSLYFNIITFILHSLSYQSHFGFHLCLDFKFPKCPPYVCALRFTFALSCPKGALHCQAPVSSTSRLFYFQIWVHDMLTQNFLSYTIIISDRSLKVNKRHSLLTAK